MILIDNKKPLEHECKAVGATLRLRYLSCQKQQEFNALMDDYEQFKSSKKQDPKKALDFNIRLVNLFLMGVKINGTTTDFNGPASEKIVVGDLHKIANEIGGLVSELTGLSSAETKN